jgi:cis-3-alkyl-4-acyloxetan-2-one decarboxylase
MGPCFYLDRMMNIDDFKDIYPFKNNFLQLDGLNYHYVDEGQGEETMLMLHGNPTWSFFYRDLISHFSDRYRVIAPDHIGCGFSDKPQDYQYTLENHINNAVALLDELKVKNITLVVHDWGGAIGCGTVLKRKDLFKRLIILNTAAFVSSDIPFRISLCRIPLIGKFIVRAFNAFAGPATFMTTVKPLSDEIKSAFLRPYDNWHNRIATHEFVKDIPLEKNHRSRVTLQSVDDGLVSLKSLPMLICWGKHDWCFNMNFLKIWRERFPEAEVHELEAGHYLLEDKGPEIIQYIESFFKKHK